MVENKSRVCPKHGVLLKKKPVLYGLPVLGENYDDVILGGCCVDHNITHGYECPIDRAVYYLNSNGELYADPDEEIDTDPQIKEE